MKMHHFLMIASLLLIGFVRGTPFGAPNTCCEAMVPGHNDTSPQDGDATNFSTVPESTKIAEDGKVKLAISSGDLSITFKGYLVVANMAGTDHIVGYFKIPSDGQILDCKLSNGQIAFQSGATHSNNYEKSLVTVDWYPNGFVGEVVFKTTYVLNASTYWVKKSSVTVQVGEAVETDSAIMSYSAQPSILLATMAFVFCALLMR